MKSNRLVLYLYLLVCSVLAVSAACVYSYYAATLLLLPITRFTRLMASVADDHPIPDPDLYCTC
jgi:hypothetical protein